MRAEHVAHRDDANDTLVGVDHRHVFHLIDDLDEPGVTDIRQQDLVKISERVSTAMRRRFPLLRLHQWVIMRVGTEVGPGEALLMDELASRSEFVTLIITSGSAVSAIDPEEVITDRAADVVHAITVGTGFATLFEAREHRVFGVGCGAVRVESAATADAAVLKGLIGAIGQLATITAADPAYVVGRREVRDLKLQAIPGSQLDDSEQIALGSTSGTGSAETEPLERLHRLERDIDRLPPELWAGYVREVVDQTCATAGGITTRRSPLARVLDDIEQISEQRAELLAAAIDERARSLLLRTKSIPALEQWCEGVVTALDESATVLRTRVTDEAEGIDLAAAHHRLEVVARRLPYAGSSLARGVLITAIAFVIHYALAPIGSFLASTSGRSLPPVGSDIFDSSRLWARILAMATGAAVWAWWEWSWRRVLRLRRRYTRSAEALIRGSVREHIRRRRIWILERLIERVGDDRLEAGSLRAWASTLGDATTALLKIAESGPPTPGEEPINPWSVVIEAEPSQSETADGAGIDKIFGNLVHALASTSNSVDMDKIIGAAIRAVRSASDGDPKLLSNTLIDGIEKRAEVQRAISMRCAPSLPFLEHFRSEESLPVHILPEGVTIATPEDWPDGESTRHVALLSTDRSFSALLWLTPLQHVQPPSSDAAQ